MKNEALIKFWKVLVYEFNRENMKELMEDGSMGYDHSEDAYDIAMHECIYEPIDTRFCMVFHADNGWTLFEANGSTIIRNIDAGDMGESRKS